MYSVFALDYSGKWLMLANGDLDTCITEYDKAVASLSHYEVVLVNSNCEIVQRKVLDMCQQCFSICNGAFCSDECREAFYHGNDHYESSFDVYDADTYPGGMIE